MAETASRRAHRAWLTHVTFPGRDPSVMHRRTIARPFAALLLSVLVVVLAACGSSSSDDDGGSAGAATTAASAAAAPGIPDGPIKIGAPLGLTGFVGFYDVPLLAGMRMAVEEINASGGVLGHRIELVTADTKSDPAQIANAATQVLDKGAQFVVPTMDYDFGGPAARVANAAKIVSVSSAGDPRFGRQGIGEYAFNLYPASPTEGAVAAEFALERGWRGVYLLEDTSGSHPKTVCSAFKQAFEAGGGTIAGEDTFQNRDQSIASQITRMRGSLDDAQAIMACTFPPGGISAVRQIRSAGVELPLIVDASFDGTFWLDAVPDEDNVFVTSTGAVTPGQNRDPKQQRLFEAFQRATGRPAVYGTGLLTGYSAVEALAKAIEEARSVDSDAVVAKLEAFRETPLTIGSVTWTEQCHVPLGAPLSVLQIKGGKQQFATTIRPDHVSRDVC